MKLKDGYIVSFFKNSPTSPWSITLRLDDEDLTEYTTSIGPAGRVPVGPKLGAFLQETNVSIKKYPYHYGMQQVVDRTVRFLAVSLLNGTPSFLEVSDRTLKFLRKSVQMNHQSLYTKTFHFNKEKQEVVLNSIVLRNADIDSPSYDETLEENRYFILLDGGSALAESGDTVKATIAGHLWPKNEEIPLMIGNQSLEIGRQLSFSYFGVESPLPLTHPQVGRNKAFATHYKIPELYVEMAGEEAKRKNMTLVRTNKLLALSIQHQGGKIVGVGPESLPLGILYQTDFQTPLEAQGAVEEVQEWKNLNLEMLRHYPDINLEIQKEQTEAFIIPFGRYVASKHRELLANQPKKASRLPVENEFGPSDSPTIDTEDWKDILGQEAPSLSDIQNSNQQKVEVITESYQEEDIEGFISNSTNFVVPFDDRLISRTLYGEMTPEDEIWDYENRVRIGDVMLPIPPLNIQQERQYQNQEIKALRSSSALQVQGNHTKIHLVLDFYIDSMVEINGHPIQAPVQLLDDPKNNVWYLDGLRPLLAQFKKAPFLPIDNGYINEHLHVHNVALKNILIETIPEFPEALKVRMVLQEFNPQTYLTSSDKLGTRLNYPLLRWHYQHLLVDSIEKHPWKKVLPKAEKLDNTFSFKTVSSDYLYERKKAIAQLRTLKTPLEIEKQFRDRNGKDTGFIKDKDHLDQSLKLIEKWNQLYASADSKWKTHSLGFPLIVGHDTYGGGTGYKIGFDIPKNQPSFASWVKQGRKHAITLYGEDKQHPGFSKNPLVTGTSVGNANALQLQNMVVPKFAKRIEVVKTHQAIEQDIQVYDDETFEKSPLFGNTIEVKKVYLKTVGYGEIYPQLSEELKEALIRKIGSLDDLLSFDKVHHGVSYALIELSSEEMQGTVDKELKLKNKSLRKNNVYYIPLESFGSYKVDISSAFAQLSKKYEEVVTTAKNEIEEYQEVIAMIRDSENEATLKRNMIEWTIPDFLPQGMSVFFENNFSEIQTQSHEAPTMQYLGGGTPKVQLSFETTPDGVEQIDSMFRQVSSNIRQYRDGIVSGFMKIENSFLNMTGIEYVLPDSISTLTVPNHPDRIQVNMTLVGFDVTQRKQESLYKYTGADPSDELLDRVYGEGYSPRKDAFYLSKKVKQLELYPDLDLPFVASLEKDLKILQAGIPSHYQIKKWQNPTNQKYLDPDFYYSSEYTFRENLRDLLNDQKVGVQTQVKDASGVTTIANLDSDFVYTMDAEETSESMASIEELYGPHSEMVRAGDWEWKDPVLTIGDINAENTSSQILDEMSTTTENGEIPESSYAIRSFYKNKMDEKVSKDTFEMWPKAIGYGKEWTWEEMEVFNKNPERLGQISEDEVIRYLSKEVLRIFGTELLGFAPHEYKTISEWNNAWASSIRLENYYTKESTFAFGTFSFASPRQYYSYSHAVLEKGKGHQNQYQKLKHGDKPSSVPEDLARFLAMKAGSTYGAPPKLPFQRLMMYLKAVLAETGSWTPFINGKAKVSRRDERNIPIRIGLFGYPSVNTDGSVQSRLVWDWQYNASKTIELLKKNYQLLADSFVLEVRARALDWAIIQTFGYEVPDFFGKRPSGLLGNSLKKALEAEYLGGKVAPESSNYFKSVASHLSRYNAFSTSSATALYTGSNGKTLRKVYQVYAGEPYHSNGEEIQDRTDQELHNSDNLLEDQSAISVLFKTMFTDMLVHDHAGRMVRAFPSFVCQIIDEGKWFTNFKTWDNVYGMNSLVSMDIYRSRKIVSDTAMLSLSNIYGGLTGRKRSMEHQDLTMPSFFSSQFWSEYVFGNGTDEDIRARKELYETLYIETGARLHLRLGYGADPSLLPVVFNGTITEVEYGDVVSIVAQGDGLELSNIVSAEEGDKNKGFFMITEPSEYIGQLLTTKGNWIQNVINKVSDGAFYKENPSGIAHFGMSNVAELGNVYPFNESFGESVMNVYSQNGKGTYSQMQTQYEDDTKELAAYMPRWSNLFSGNFGEWKSSYDEDNILLDIYGMTVWDIVQTFAYCSSDYIASVVPFEYRSTLFFGKPHWPYAYQYVSKYSKDMGDYTKESKEDLKWRREIVKVKKKPFMQAHIYSSSDNIISNQIIASEEGVYPNVIVTYDGRVTPLIQADNDIRFDKQKTTTVEARILARMKGNLTNFWSVESQARRFGHSTVRDFMKDMYKGDLLVLGDATTKPYDMVYLSDTIQDMQGCFLVKAVHHEFSVDTGFITHVEPDALVTNWDYEILSISDYMLSFGKRASAKMVQHSMIFGASTFLSAIVSNTMGQWVSGITESAFLSKNVSALANWTADKQFLAIARMNKGTEVGKILEPGLREYRAARQIVREASKGSSEAIATAQRLMRQSRSKALGQVTEAVLEYKSQYKSAQALTKTMKTNAKFAVDTAKATNEMLDEMVAFTKGAKAIKDNVRDTSLLIKTSQGLASTTKNTLAIGKTLLTSATFWNIIISVSFELLVSGLLEKWRRRKQDMQCVMIYPLQYRGSNLSAGINGNQGSVRGDAPSKADQWYHAEFGKGGTDEDLGAFSFIPKIINFFS